MIGTDKQIIESLKIQRNQYADDCAELKAAWDACMLRIAQLEKELAVYRALGDGPENGGEQSEFYRPTNDETGVIAP
jgi:chorismate mutase